MKVIMMLVLFIAEMAALPGWAAAQTEPPPVSTPASAPAPTLPPPPPPAPPPAVIAAATPHQHTGFYMRLMLGGGYTTFSETAGGSENKVAGGAADLDFNFGYFVAPNLAVGADIGGSAVPGPTVSMNGTDLGTSKTDLDLYNIGVSLTYF